MSRTTRDRPRRSRQRLGHGGGDQSGGDLKQQAVSGMLWMGGSRLSTQFLDQIFTIVLVRILVPGDYGLMAMAGAFTTLFNMFADMGMARAVVQRQDVDDEYLSTAFWGNLASGALLCLLGIVASVPIAAFFKQPLVQPVFAVLSLRFIFAGASGTQMALLTRHMRFSALVTRDVTGIVLGGGLGIGLALGGAGVWSLVGQTLFTIFAQMVLLWLATPWRPKRMFSREKFRSLWEFGSRVLGSRIFSYVVKQADNILIGRILGPTLLGYYAFGYGMFLAPMINISIIVGRVALTAFARLQDDLERLRRGFLITTRYVSFLSFPVLLGFFLVAPDAVMVIFGERWLPAVPVLRVLLIAGMMQSHSNIWASVYQALGRVDWLFWLSVASACLYVPAFIIGIRWGILGVAVGYTISSLVLLPVQLVLVQRLLGFRMREYLSTYVPVGIASGLMAAGVLLGQAWLGQLDVAPALRLALTVVVGALIYMVAVVVVGRDLVTGFFAIVREFRAARHPRVAGTSL